MIQTDGRLLLGTNLKMYKTPRETAAYISALNPVADRFRDCLTVFVIPSFPALPAAIAADNGQILLGSQNVFYEEEGPFTGEVSLRMLEDLEGISLVEIGHSERRHLFGETSFDCNRKVLAAADHHFSPLLCIGETAQERDYGITEEVLRTQLKIGLFGYTVQQPVWIAYEPVWAIGESGTAATPDYIEHCHRLIRTTLLQLLGDMGNSVPILYGGSVNHDNLSSFLMLPNVDGLFIGRAAWQADSFTSLIHQAVPLWQHKLTR